MKRYIYIISTILLLIIIAFSYFKNISGWLEFNTNNYTPKEYKSTVKVSKEQYSKDSLYLVSNIREKINKHVSPYTNFVRKNGNLYYINDSVTKIYIDSIFYSQDFKKIAFLVIVENDTKKNYKGSYTYEGTFFDGNCFIGKKENNLFKNFYYGCSFSNSKSYKEISNSLRNNCLNNIKKDHYNFDDKRFWASKDW